MSATLPKAPMSAVLMCLLVGLASGLTPHQEGRNCTLRDTCSLQQHLSDPRLYTCSCDSTCTLYGDCCPSYPAAAGSWEGTMSDVANCRILRPVSIKNAVYIIDKCPSDFDDADIRGLCESRVMLHKMRRARSFTDSTGDYYPRQISEEDGITPFVPVSSETEGVMYRNVFCAICNGAQNTTFWNIHIPSPQPINSAAVDQPSELQNLFNGAWRRMYVTFTHPKVSPIPCRMKVINTCPDVASDEEVEACQGPTSRVFDDGIVYRNKHCATCNMVNESDLSCIDPLPLLISMTIPGRRFLPYAVLLDLNAGTATLHSNKIGYEKIILSSNCTEGRVYDPIFGLCTEICSTGTEDSGLQVCTNINSSSSFSEVQHWLLRFKFDIGMSYLTLVGNALSMCGLIVLLGVYSLLVVLRNTPGRCLMCLSCSLLLAQILFMVAGQKLGPAPMCMVVAMVMHYCFLAQFCWMNSMAFDVWRAFKVETQSFRAKAKTRCRHFVYYSAYSWTVPALIVAVSFLLDQLDCVVRPAYGHSFCWFGSRLGLLVLFALPVGLIIFVNCVFFSLTARNICQATEGSDILHPGHKEHRRRLFLYIKLAVIMGLAWIVGFLATALDNTILWYIFTVTNAFQGLFICISFVFTQKVYKAMRGELQRCNHKQVRRGSPEGTTNIRHTGLSSKKTSVETTVMSSRGRSTR